MVSILLAIQFVTIAAIVGYEYKIVCLYSCGNSSANVWYATFACYPAG